MMVQQFKYDSAIVEHNAMHIVDLSHVVAEENSLEDALARTDGLWEEIYEAMDATETLWVIAPNAYRNGRLWPTSMAAADYARDEASFSLKNTITVHRWEDRGGNMESAYDEILFLVKDKHQYQFHKDNIRVSHVYEGKEWGNRETGTSAYHDTEVRRYNPDGKDPGNVWLEEDRTQTENQEVDEVHPIKLEEAVRRCVLAGSSEGEVVKLYWSTEFEEVITNAGREVEYGKETESEGVVQ